MRSKRKRRSGRFPLQLTIATVFSILFLIVGLALISYHYLESRRMAMLTANRSMARTSLYLERTISDLYGPVRNLVDIASRVLPPTEGSLEDRLESLPFLAEPLRLRPMISAVFIGYDSGSLFLVRAVDSGWRSRAGEAPPADARFLVQDIERDGSGAARETWLFYNDRLELVARSASDVSDFDARNRDWFSSSLNQDKAAATGFYLFHTTRETGLTISRRLMHGGGTVGADLTLRDLEAALERQKVTPSTRIAVLDSDGGVIALSTGSEKVPLATGQSGERIEMPYIGSLGDPLYEDLADRFGDEVRVGRQMKTIADRDWLISLSELPSRADETVYLAVLVPRSELLASVNRARNNGLMISLGLLGGALLLVAWVSRNISRSLGSLADEAASVRALRFDEPISIESRIREVDELAETMGLMKSALQQFLDISHALSAEKDLGRVLEMVLSEARKVSKADGGAVLMIGEDDETLDLVLLAEAASGEVRQQLSDATMWPDSIDLGEPSEPPSVDRVTAQSAERVLIEDLSRDERFDASAIRSRYDREGFVTRSLLSIPLCNQQDEVIGVLQLVKSDGPVAGAAGFRPEVVPYVEALASDAAVALDIRRLLKAQRDLLDALIHMIAGAIDAKSPYTHGHCQRVPVVARMLAEAAQDSQSREFAGFALSEDEWYQLHLASWLHDCGKVTTPEYVVDKATKLETIYNRIHEIRMRFEVLWRDAEIEYHKALAAGAGDESVLEQRLRDRHAEIAADFARIARSNLGDEELTDDALAEIHRIGSQTWMRHLDDRLGLSHGELLQRGDHATSLPVRETLLADKPEHIIARPAGQSPFGDQPHGFRMQVPENQYNRGELHNLCVRRGTLTTEERFKINEHVVQTIRMLERMPFPKELRKVPDWAGNHHERLDGTGYPRRLGAAELSVPERIMAIADIFEALTARDRPYSAPRPLSLAIEIMGSMCAEGHLCPDLFALFLRSGVYLEYGEEYLDPEQLDSVDVDSVLATASDRSPGFA